MTRNEASAQRAEAAALEHDIFTDPRIQRF